MVQPWFIRKSRLAGCIKYSLPLFPPDLLHLGVSPGVFELWQVTMSGETRHRTLQFETQLLYQASCLSTLMVVGFES